MSLPPNIIITAHLHGRFQILIHTGTKLRINLGQWLRAVMDPAYELLGFLQSHLILLFNENPIKLLILIIEDALRLQERGGHHSLSFYDVHLLLVVSSLHLVLKVHLA